jgi:hypothetical protein
MWFPATTVFGTVPAAQMTSFKQHVLDPLYEAELHHEQ